MTTENIWYSMVAYYGSRVAVKKAMPMMYEKYAPKVKRVRVSEHISTIPLDEKRNTHKGIKQLKQMPKVKVNKPKSVLVMDKSYNNKYKQLISQVNMLYER